MYDDEKKMKNGKPDSAIDKVAHVLDYDDYEYGPYPMQIKPTGTRR